MSKPFSQDLRKRVVAAVESGTEPEKVAEIFQVHVTTVEKWIILKKETGSLEIKSGYQNGHIAEANQHYTIAPKN